MKQIVISIFILLIAFFQTVVIEYNFLLVFVLVFAFVWSETWAFAVAFLSGFFLDLFSGNRLGYSSLSLIFPTFLLILYRQRFDFKNPLVILFATVIYYVLFSKISGHPLKLIEVLSLIGLMTAFRLMAPPLFKTTEPDRLKV